MTKTQAGIVAAMSVIVGILTVPPYLDARKMNAAIIRLEVISDAAMRYAHQTDQPAPNPHALLGDPGVKSWRGPYLDSQSQLETPWGGTFVFDVERGLVGIASHHAAVPERYRLGGVAELSMPIRDDPAWWASHDADSD